MHTILCIQNEAMDYDFIPSKYPPEIFSEQQVVSFTYFVHFSKETETGGRESYICVHMTFLGLTGRCGFLFMCSFFPEDFMTAWGRARI